MSDVVLAASFETSQDITEQLEAATEGQKAALQKRIDELEDHLTREGSLNLDLQARYFSRQLVGGLRGRVIGCREAKVIGCREAKHFYIFLMGNHLPSKIVN